MAAREESSLLLCLGPQMSQKSQFPTILGRNSKAYLPLFLFFFSFPFLYSYRNKFSEEISGNEKIIIPFSVALWGQLMSGGCS